MNTDDLTRAYRSVRVDDDAVPRVLSAVARAEPRARPATRRTGSAKVWLSAVGAAALITAIAVAAVGLGGRSTNDEPPAIRSPRPTVVLPTVAPDTVSGAVLTHGRPLAGAYVTVNLWPNSAVESQLKDGETVPIKNLGTVTTNAHGGFVSQVPASLAEDRTYLEGDVINTEIDVQSGNTMTEWNVPITVRRGRTDGLRIVFDLARRTVTVDGQTSTLPIN